MLNSSVEVASVISSIVQALASCVLVGVTIYYAIQSKKTVNTMERSSKAEFLPIIAPTILRATSDSTTLHVKFTNQGRGLAKRPFKISFPGTAPLFINSLPEKGEQEVKVKYDINYILSLSAHDRKMVVEYQDIFGRTVQTEVFFVEGNTFGPNRNSQGLNLEAWYCNIPE